MPPAQHYPEPTVGALIFDPEGRLFLMQSHKWGGRYVVPGGHVELGETLEAALMHFGPEYHTSRAAIDHHLQFFHHTGITVGLLVPILAGIAPASSWAQTRASCPLTIVTM